MEGPRPGGVPPGQGEIVGVPKALWERIPPALRCMHNLMRQKAGLPAWDWDPGREEAAAVAGELAAMLEQIGREVTRG